MRCDLTKQSRESSRSIGFPKSSQATGSTSAILGRRSMVNIAVSSPVAKPNKARKGRWFVTLVIVSLMGFVAISVWNEFFRFQAFGQLEGTKIELSTAADGIVSAVHVHEGDLVDAGQLLVEIDIPELEFQRQQIARQLQLSVSDLQIRLAELESQDRQLRADELDRVSRYYQLLSQFHQDQSNLERLRNDFETSTRLFRENAIAQSDFVAAKTAYEGQESQLKQMAIAIRTLEPSSTVTGSSKTNQLLNDEMELVKRFQIELSQVEGLLQAKQIRAPVAGRILKRSSEPGERLASNTLVLEMVESASVEAVIYLPQKRAAALAVGDLVRIRVTPLGTQQIFRIERFAPEVVVPPPAIQANYRAFKGLVRVHAKPIERVGDSNSLIDLTSWVGAELSLPSFGFRTQVATERHHHGLAKPKSEPTPPTQLSMTSGGN